jgi:hypothetical protein
MADHHQPQMDGGVQAQLEEAVPPSRQKSKRDSAYRLYATSRKPMESAENAFGVDDGDGAVGTGHDLRHRPRAAVRPPRRSRFGRELLGRGPLRDAFTDGFQPTPGTDSYILVRAANNYGDGRYCFATSGTERTTGVCPWAAHVG